MTKPVTIRGVAYPSMKAAAAALGVTSQTVQSANRRGTLDNIGQGPLKPGCVGPSRRETRVGGQSYPSRKAAAAALGVTATALSMYFQVRDAIALCAAHNQGDNNYDN